MLHPARHDKGWPRHTVHLTDIPRYPADIVQFPDFVMAGLVPAIHAALPRRSLLPKKNVSYQMLILTGQCSRGQPWVKPGHDAFSPANA